MATVSKFTSTAKIFDKASRSQGFTSLISREAKEFKVDTKERMIEGPASGRVYEKHPGGRGFTRSHRASRRGQRPAPDTLTLVNAISDRRLSDYSAEVYVAERINPENGEIASDYAERLQTQLDRPIMSPLDAEKAEFKLRHGGELLVRTLV